MEEGADLGAGCMELGRGGVRSSGTSCFKSCDHIRHPTCHRFGPAPSNWALSRSGAAGPMLGGENLSGEESRGGPRLPRKAPRKASRPGRRTALKTISMSCPSSQPSEVGSSSRARPWDGPAHPCRGTKISPPPSGASAWQDELGGLANRAGGWANEVSRWVGDGRPGRPTGNRLP